MKAMQYRRYGGPEVIELCELPRPDPGPGQALIRVEACALNPKDALTRSGKFARLAGPSFPKGLCYDYAGTVAAVGAGVTDVVAGDAVYGMLNGWNACAAAEYLLAGPEERARRPMSIAAAAAAGLPLAAQTALQALRDLGGVGPGSRVAIHGASGGVGTVAVQIAKCLGAEVTALCGADAADLVRGLGADSVQDYRVIPPPALPGQFDCIFDVFGNQSLAKLRSRLAPRGRYVSTVPNPRNFRDHLLTRWWPGRRGLLVVVKSRRADLEQLAAWVNAGQLRPVVAHTLTLEDMRKAHELIQSKRTHGKIILTVA